MFNFHQTTLNYKTCAGNDPIDRTYHATVTRTTTFADGNTLTAAQLNNEYNNLLNALSLVNADISASAAIVESKLLFSATGHGHTGGTDGKAVAQLGANTFTGAQTLTGGLTTVKSTAQTLVADTDGATISFDLSAGNIHSVTLGANRTLALSNPTVGQAFVIRLIQDGSGNRTVTWFSTIKWVNGAAPTLSTTASKIDTFGFICTSSGNYDGYIIGLGLS